MLVQWFTALGFDTGYSLQQARSNVDGISWAGLEHNLFEDDLPHVVKSPWFSEQIGGALAEKSLEVEAAIIPVRDLHVAAESRRRVFFEARDRGLDPWQHPGSLWKVEKPEDQEQALALEFYNLLFPLIVHRIPLYFLHFPRFIVDGGYLFESLQPVLSRHGITRSLATTAHRTVARPDRVHALA